MKVYIEGSDDKKKDDENFLPELTEGMELKNEKLDSKQHFTQPPPRYTEARLVRTMEELGLGRPSTYAPTLDTIQRRNYVTLEDRKFVPTELGEVVLEQIVEFFPEIIDVDFTAKMEDDLDAIEEGKIGWVKVIADFYHDFEKHLEKAEKEMKEVEIKDEPAGVDCEKCGNELVIKMGRYGKFMACSNFPDCRNAKPILKKVGVTCPNCKEGDIVERRSNKKRRKFFGCDRYPDCDFISWDKPLPRSCPKCGEYLIEKRSKKKTTVQCSNCDYKEETQ